MIEDPNSRISRYNNTLQKTLVAHGIVALAGIIPAFGAFLFSQDQLIHATGLIVSGTIETGNIIQLRSNLRRSRVQS